jgi:hypothetical protein
LRGGNRQQAHFAAGHMRGDLHGPAREHVDMAAEQRGYRFTGGIEGNHLGFLDVDLSRHQRQAEGNMVRAAERAAEREAQAGGILAQRFDQVLACLQWRIGAHCKSDVFGQHHCLGREIPEGQLEPAVDVAGVQRR